MDDDDLEPIDVGGARNASTGPPPRGGLSRAWTIAVGVAVVVVVFAGTVTVFGRTGRHKRSAGVPSGATPAPVLAPSPPPSSAETTRGSSRAVKTFTFGGNDILAAFGSIWLSQPDQVLRYNPTT